MGCSINIVQPQMNPFGLRLYIVTAAYSLLILSLDLEYFFQIKKYIYNKTKVSSELIPFI